MSKSHKSVARQMLSLRPGDVITGLKCGGDDCSSRKILVLARCGNDHFDFSQWADDINIVRDPEGPYRWNEQEEVFRNANGVAHDHIGPDAVVLESAGLLQLGWYRELKSSSAARFFIEPSNLLGVVSEPGTLAKIEALMNRSVDDPVERVKNVSLAMDLIFAGNEMVLDERRMRLLHILVNFAATVQVRGIHRSTADDLMSQLFGGMSEVPLHEFLGNLTSGLREERQQRRRSAG